MYSKEELSDIFQRILKFEQDAKSAYDNCIKEVNHEHSINILQSISNEEEGHIEQAKKLFKIIKKDIPRTKSAEDLPKEASS
jgi:bacterioferritin (cytochrome b1)